MCTLVYAYACYSCIVGQSCVDTVNVERKGSDAFEGSFQVIIPKIKFSCNGRITGYNISLESVGDNPQHYPTVQVWRPTNSSSYKWINELVNGDVANNCSEEYCLANVIFTDNNRVEFQPGDIIGYTTPHQGNNYYTVWSTETGGYISYATITTGSRIPTTFDIIENIRREEWQPLIKVLYGK